MLPFSISFSFLCGNKVIPLLKTWLDVEVGFVIIILESYCDDNYSTTRDLHCFSLNADNN